MTIPGPAAAAAPVARPQLPGASRIVLLHGGDAVPGWAAAAGVITAAASPDADLVAVAGMLTEADCVLLDVDTLDALATARRLHAADPEIQVVAVATTEARRRALERAIVYTPGIGELWLASPTEVAGGIGERAAGVTRQRRKFRRTRERMERERIEASPQRRERALISDAYLANLLQVLPDPVFSVDANGRVLSANPAAHRALGLDGPDLTGAALARLLGASDAHVADALAAAAEQSSRSEISFRRGDGSSGRGELLVTRVVESDVVLFAIVLHDLTERYQAQRELEGRTRDLEHANHQLQEQTMELEMQAQELQSAMAELEQRTEEAERAHAALAESEQQFRTLADAIPTLAWTSRADGYIDWYNARWYEYTGTTPAEMEGTGWKKVHHPDVLPDVVELWTRSLTTGEPFEMTFPLRSADGEYRAFLTRVIPVRDADGRVVRWFGTNTDVEAERTARAAAEAANRAKSEFLSTMSHELRTPLNAIQGYTELLALGVRGPVTDEQLQDLERVRRANQYLMSLITDVLNFARLEAGQVDLAITDVELAPLVADVESLIAPQLAARRLTLDHAGCAPDASGPADVVRADPEKLRQVLLNLLTNAIKFTDAGGHVAVACEPDPAAGVVRVRVSDTGRGIPAAQLERIFEPFVQVDRHRTAASQQGVGLGLAISRDLVRAMGGDLTVMSEVGVGSTFTVELPRA